MLATYLWIGGYLVSALGLGAFTYLYWRNRNLEGVPYLMLAAGIGSLLSLVYTSVIVTGTLSLKVSLWKSYSTMVALLLFLWYAFVVTWTERERLGSELGLAAAGLPLLGFAALIVTNTAPGFDGYHSLYWGQVGTIGTGGLLSALRFIHQPLYWVHGAYIALLLLGSIVLLARYTSRPEQRLYRWRNVMLVLAALSALVIELEFTLLRTPYQSLPIGLLLGNVFAAVAVFRFGGFDVVSLPENSLIEAIEGGILIFGLDGQIIDMNSAAKDALELTDEAVGRGIVAVVELTETLPSVRSNGADEDGDRPVSDPASVSQLLDGHEFSTPIDGESRTFLVRVSELTDEDSNRLGWTVLFYDVTELRRKQQELDLLKQVLSRVLRHNVRNDLSVVKTNAQLLADEADGLEAERLNTVIDKSQNLLEASEKARAVERVLDYDRERRELDLVDAVEDAVSDVRSEFPDATISTDLPEAARAKAHWGLSVALENLIENGVRHNDADSPRVDVSVRVDGDCVEVRIADNGPGIPQQELTVLERGEETPLEHGSGIGLWLVNWVAELSHADLDFENTSRGCTVTVGLEAAETTSSGVVADVLDA
jgi:signal transduction histidine kinase